MLVSTLSLRHIVKMLLHLETVTKGTRETPGVAPPQRTHHRRESSRREFTRSTQRHNTDIFVELHQL